MLRLTRGCRRRPPTCRPRLEALEQRACLCSMEQVGSALTIVGDRGSDVLDVSDRGTLGLRVACNAQQRTFFGVQRINVDVREGNDRVNIEILPYIEQTQVRGGNGDDEMIVAIVSDDERGVTQATQRVAGRGRTDE